MVVYWLSISPIFYRTTLRVYIDIFMSFATNHTPDPCSTMLRDLCFQPYVPLQGAIQLQLQSVDYNALAALLPDARSIARRAGREKEREGERERERQRGRQRGRGGRDRGGREGDKAEERGGEIER